MAGAVACCVGAPAGGRNVVPRVEGGGGAVFATWLAGGTRGGGGVTLSPCGRLGIVGLCSDDSAGGASLPRAGGLRCCELLPGTFEPGDDDGFDDAVADGAGGGAGDVVAGGGGGGAAATGGGAALAVVFGEGGAGEGGSAEGGAAEGGADGAGAGGADEDGGEAGVAEAMVAELLAGAGVLDVSGVLRVGGTGGGTVLATSPARRLSALYCALLRSATRLFTSLSRSTPLSCASGDDGTLPRLG